MRKDFITYKKSSDSKVALSSKEWECRQRRHWSEEPVRDPGREIVLLLRERGPCGHKCIRDQSTAFSNSSICLEVEGNSLPGQTSWFQQNR